jgi:osmotically inducible protein OsmC
MPVRKAHAQWEGNLTDGKGIVKFGSFSGAYSFASRFENGEGTNPEELIGSAHAGCFSMALAHEIAQKGYTPKRISTDALVHLDKVGDGFSIATIELVTEADIPDIDKETFLKIAEGAKNNCPVSKVLTGLKIQLKATLL